MVGTGMDIRGITLAWLKTTADHVGTLPRTSTTLEKIGLNIGVKVVHLIEVVIMEK
jgi:hypothetical protein